MAFLWNTNALSTIQLCEKKCIDHTLVLNSVGKLCYYRKHNNVFFSCIIQLEMELGSPCTFYSKALSLVFNRPGRKDTGRPHGHGLPSSGYRHLSGALMFSRESFPLSVRLFLGWSTKSLRHRKLGSFFLASHGSDCFLQRYLS